MGAEPQAPIGDLMAQPEDGAATPTPEEPPAEAPAEPMAAEPQGQLPPFFSEGVDFNISDDEDILLDAAKKIEDPEIKQQVIALVYQAIESKKAPPMPPVSAGPAPEEILAAAMDANGDGMVSEDELVSMTRSATESVKCDANPADIIEKSDDEKKEDDDKEEKESDEKDDKSERPKKEEPGVNDELPEGEEDKDSLEELPEVTEVKIETEVPEEEQTPEETEDEKEEAIESIIDSILEEVKERIKEQVIEAIEGIDAEHSPFMMSTAEMMKSFRSGKKSAAKTGPIKKSIDWPEDVRSLAMEDKCRFFAKSFSQMDAKMQDDVVTLMDTRLGSEVTSQIFKSEGVDLDSYYEPVAKAFEGNLDTVPATSQAAKPSDISTATDATEGVATEPKTESCAESAVQECNDSTVQNSEEDTESLEACKKSADVPAGIGMHIPTVNEMMQFKKSGTSIYTPISREAAEPHGMVAMGPDNEIPSVKEMFAKRFGN